MEMLWEDLKCDFTLSGVSNKFNKSNHEYISNYS